MPRRYAKKRDENEPDIVSALKGVGASVYKMDGLGAGFPDLLVGHNGRNLLLEVKNPDDTRGGGRQYKARKQGGLDDDQVIWHANHRGQVAVVTTVDEAIQAVMSRR